VPHLLSYYTNPDIGPVEIVVSADGKKIKVQPVSDDYLALARLPAYKNSSLVQNSAAASRLIVTSSSYVSNMLLSGAESFMNKTKPNEKPMVFQPATHERARKINALTTGVAGFSAKTVGQLSKHAQNFTASTLGKGPRRAKAVLPDGTPNPDYKPGLLNKSMIAFTTVADGIAYSGKNLLTHGGAAASAAIGHKYGTDAGSISSELAGGVKNVGLVYIDVTGVSRKAIITSVAKGMVVGKVRDKKGVEQTVMVGGGDGGVVNPTDFHQGVKNTGVPVGETGGPSGQIGFGNVPPPTYSTGIGEPLQGQPAYGYPPEKK
jgi:spartin